MEYINPTALAVPETESAFVACSTDYTLRHNTWREVSEDHYYEALGAVPPIYVKGYDGFLMGEAYDYWERGGETYCGFLRVGEKFYSRIIPQREAGAWCKALLDVLTKRETGANGGKTKDSSGHHD